MGSRGGREELGFPRNPGEQGWGSQSSEKEVHTGIFLPGTLPEILSLFLEEVPERALCKPGEGGCWGTCWEPSHSQTTLAGTFNWMVNLNPSDLCSPSLQINMRTKTGRSLETALLPLPCSLLLNKWETEAYIENEVNSQGPQVGLLASGVPSELAALVKSCWAEPGLCFEAGSAPQQLVDPGRGSQASVSHR